MRNGHPARKNRESLQWVDKSLLYNIGFPYPIASMGLVYLPTCKPYKLIIHLGTFTIVPWIRHGYEDLLFQFIIVSLHERLGL